MKPSLSVPSAELYDSISTARWVPMSPAHRRRLRGSPDRRARAMTAGSSARGPRGVHCVADAHRGSSGSRGAAVVADIEGVSPPPRLTNVAPAAVRARVVAPAVSRMRRLMPVVRVVTRAAGSGGSWVSRRRWSMASVTSRSRRHGEGSRPSARCAASWAAVSRASRDAAWSVSTAASVSRVARPRVVLCWSRWETASGFRSHRWSVARRARSIGGAVRMATTSAVTTGSSALSASPLTSSAAGVAGAAWRAAPRTAARACSPGRPASTTSFQVRLSRASASAVTLLARSVSRRARCATEQSSGQRAATNSAKSP